jgi:hypothetical protein
LFDFTKEFLLEGRFAVKGNQEQDLINVEQMIGEILDKIKKARHSGSFPIPEAGTDSACLSGFITASHTFDVVSSPNVSVPVLIGEPNPQESQSLNVAVGVTTSVPTTAHL